ncbi:MAG: IS200/IS605 family transposase [Ardenticatenaceae bacterium]|nr:IS200/IS605 family transposase [Ardenticatenaceae bacterium]
MGQQPRHKRTSVSFVNYYFVFCPKRRKKVLVNAVKDRLEELVLEKAQEIDCQVLKLAVRPDHVHLFVSCPPTLAPHQIVHRIKSYTSRVLRQEFPHLLKLPSLWTRSYWVSTAGNVSSDTIQRYIEEQDG